MKKTSLAHLHCPVARSLEQVGQWWNILILRDAFYGLSRFDQFQESLGIAPSILTRRLNDLVERGLLERQAYNDAPPRFDYLLTARGRDFRPVLLTLMDWGNKHLSPEGPATQLVDDGSGELVELALIDKRTGQAISRQHKVVAGPAADEPMLRRFEKRRQLAARQPPDIAHPLPANR
ncbi:winged helix-turn-helix transcriptional regulator [Pseudomonas sp. MWU13-2100]|uniref:winged helix-turn-helix transcriptional regulator n=1 Tax=Pseudomonas sp. MWU13-2100 TaxID=2935075 RepID=UPI00200DE02D|nr:helix-turn-helix domain-containing protein [Pseudomonas sp. MWU13-2100]